MAERIKINDGTKTYEIVNQDDVVLGTFTFNPSDANIVKRYNDVVDQLRRYADEVKDEVFTPEKLIEAQDKIVGMMNELTGADTSQTFFSICGALSPMANGNVYAENVLEGIGAVIEKETKKRIQRMDAQANKYLENYNK